MSHITTTSTITATPGGPGAAAEDDGAVSEAAGPADVACAAATFDEPSSARFKMDRLTATPSCADWKK